MKKGWTIGAIVVVISFILAGCSPGDASNNPHKVSARESGRTENSEQQVKDLETNKENEDSIPRIKTTADAREYMEKCMENSLEYKDLIRYEEKCVGTDYAVNVEVSQVMSDGTLRVYDDPDGSGYYTGNEYMIRDKRVLDNTKIIENDVITLYGRYMGLTEITRAVGDITESVPAIDMYLCDIGGVSVKATAEMADYSLYEEILCNYPSEDSLYTLYDMDNDGVKELIVTYDISIGAADIYTLGIDGGMSVGGLERGICLYPSPDGEGLYVEILLREEKSYMQKAIIVNNEVQVEDVEKVDFTDSDMLEQIPTSDFSLLK